MLYRAKKSFNIARDGFTSEHVREGQIINDVPRDMARGLILEGFIENAPAGAKMAPPLENKAEVEPTDQVEPVAIPENWRDLPWPELRSLGAEVSPTVVRNKSDAIQAIEAYIGE